MKMNINNLFLLFKIFIFGISTSWAELETVYEGKYLKVVPIPYVYLHEGSYVDKVYHVQKIHEYNPTLYFNYKKAVPFDVDKSQDGRIFLTVVGKNDVNVTLTTVKESLDDGGLLLSPYPDHSWFLDRTNCSQMISVRSVTIDKCNRLWVLDSGRVDRTQLCNAKLLVFNLDTNILLESYEIPRDISQNARGMGVLVNPVVHIQDDDKNCENKIVYIADSEGYALVVFNGREYRRLSGPEYNPVRTEMNFTISGESFKLPGGIVPMSLEPKGTRLYFAPLASRDLSYIETNKLANIFNGEEQPLANTNKKVFPSQPTAMTWTSKIHDVLFIGLADNSIHCLKQSVTSQFCKDNFDTVVKDDEKLQYMSALKVFQVLPQAKVRAPKSKEELLILTNRLQKSINRSRNFEEINFRILKGSVESLLKDTKCNNIAGNNCSGTT